MAQPARPNLQTLEQALEGLGELPARLDRLNQVAREFRGILGDKLVRIRERIERVRARVGAQGAAVRELRELRQRIREHAPTAQQLQMIQNIIATINPPKLQDELTALEREVAQLEQRVAAVPPPGDTDAPTSGGYMYSRRANSARAKRSATRKKYGKPKRKTRRRKTRRRKTRRRKRARKHGHKRARKRKTRQRRRHHRRRQRR